MKSPASHHPRVFVFDVDGVLVASEKVWLEEESDTLIDMFGETIAAAIGDTVGMSIGHIYQRAKALGATISKDEYNKRYDEVAIRVYSRCSISAGTDQLGQWLLAHDWRIGVLSSSPLHWVEHVIGRLPWRDQIAAVLSVNDHPHLAPKPEPDGYREIVRQLGSSPDRTVALEDSLPGIAAAKAAGVYTIGYREHLVAGYTQTGADVYADTMAHVLRFVGSRVE